MKNRHGQSIICPSFHETTTNFEHKCSNFILKAIDLSLWEWFYKILILAFMQKFTKFRDSWLIFMLKPHVTSFFFKSVPKTTILKNGAIHFKKKRPILATFWQFWRKNGLKLKFFMKTQVSRKMKTLQKLRRCTLKIWNMFKIACNHFQMFKSMRGTQF